MKELILEKIQDVIQLRLFRKVFIILFLVGLCITGTGCAFRARMAAINEGWLVDREINETGIEPATISFRLFDQGQKVYKGRSTNFNYGGHLAKVDLASVQKIAGERVLSKLYQNVIDAPDIFEIVSYITDFRHKFPAEWRAIPPVSVSFTLHLDGIRNAQILTSKVIEIEDFRGGGEEELAVNSIGILGLIFPPLIPVFCFIDLSGNMPFLVARAATEAVYDTYRKELPQIAEIIFQDGQTVPQLSGQGNGESDNKIDGFQEGKEEAERKIESLMEAEKE